MRPLLLIVIGLALQWLATPPGPLPWLVFVADVPFLWLLGWGSRGRWIRWALLYGLLHYAVGFWWLGAITPWQVVGASIGLIPVWMVACALLRWLGRSRVPWPLAVATVLVLEEMVRTVYLGGMPWPARSLAFVAEPLFVRSTAYVGAYALSFVAAFTAAAIAGRPELDVRHALGRRLAWVAVAAGCTGILLGLGAWRTRNVEPRLVSTGSNVLLAVQATIPQKLKHAPDPDAANRVLRMHLDLSERALASAQEHGEEPIAVLWPETMLLFEFVDAYLAERYPGIWANEVRVGQNLTSVAGVKRPPFLVGALYLYRRGDEEHEGAWQYGTHDSLFLVDTNRTWPNEMEGLPEPPPVGQAPPWILGRHDKHVLVPWGEYTPFGDAWPALRRFREFVAEIPELDPGARDQAPFELGEARAATAICFELLFPARCRHLRRTGAGVLLNAANYGWFGETAFRAQLRAAAALRAAETATTVVVAGNTGPTLFYDPLGRAFGRFEDAEEGVRDDPEDDRNTFRPGWASGPLVLDPEPTPYVRWGDGPWLVLSGLVLLLGLLRTREKTPAA